MIAEEEDDDDGTTASVVLTLSEEAVNRHQKCNTYI